MIKYKDTVKITSGFYVGLTGKAIAYDDRGLYLITLDDGNNVEIPERQVEKVGE